MDEPEKPTQRRLPIWAACVLLLLGFSPSVINVFRQSIDRYRLSQTRSIPLKTDIVFSNPSPLRPLPRSELRFYASVQTQFAKQLSEQKINTKREIRLLENHFRVYQQAYTLWGPAKTHALFQMIAFASDVTTTDRLFPSPEAVLASAAQWIDFIRTVERQKTSDPELWPDLIYATRPVEMSPERVFWEAKWIVRAGYASHLPVGILAAIVDNEQSGSTLLYGISGWLRHWTDTLALRNAQYYGSSGLSGQLSQTVGITQMSWQDALLQRPRLQALGLQFGLPFPRTEADARDFLSRPYANLLFAASRLRGYLNSTYKRDSLDTRPFDDAWVYYLAPAWHNNPSWASRNKVWDYAWNGFFKAILYDQLLPEYLSLQKPS